MLAAVFIYSFASIFIKMLYNHNPALSEYEIIYWKSISMMFYNYLYIRQFGITVLDVPPMYRNHIVARALVGFWGLQGEWGAYKYMPLSITRCILMTGPIPAAFLAQYFLGEQMTKWDIITIASSLVGVMLINNPGNILNLEVQDDASKKHNYFVGTMYCLSTVIIGGAIPLLMRYMRKNIHYTISPFWFSSGCTFLSPLMYTIFAANPIAV